MDSNNRYQSYGAQNTPAPVPVINSVERLGPEKRDRLFFLLAFLLGYAFFAFGTSGDMRLGATVYFIALFAVTGAYFYPWKKCGYFPMLCGILGVLLSFGFFISAQLAVKFFSLIAVEVLYLIFAGGITGNLAYGTDDLSVTRDLLRIFFVQSVDEAGVIFRRSDKYPDGGKILRTVVKMALGIVLALPVLLIVMPLLIEADGAFKAFISNMPKLDIGDHLWYLLGAAVLTPFTAGMLFSLKHKVYKIPRKYEEFRKGKGIDPVIISGFLGIISACYLLYMFSQLGYFFSAFSGIVPEGVKTTAYYARNGFFEMCVVSAINLALIAVTTSAMKRGGVASKISGGLACFVSVFSVLLIVTAMSKMLLYISMYGASLLRILTSAFMLVLVLCFALAIIRIFKPCFPYMRILTVFCVALLMLLSYCDLEACVANYNVEVYLNENAVWHTEDIDVDYLSRDIGRPAAPALLRLYKEAEDPQVRQMAEDALLRMMRDEVDPVTGNVLHYVDWRNLTVSHLKTENAFVEYGKSAK